MKNNWKYWGVFLDAASRESLFDILPPIPDGYKPHGDHMTIIYNDGSENAQKWGEICKKQEGQKVTLSATHYGVSDKAIAVKVNGFPSNNKQPHITIATSPIGKPVGSNKIEHWEKLSEPIFLIGTVNCFAPQNKKPQD